MRPAPAWYDCRMRYVVYGAGAIGAGVGGLLHRAGVDTTLVARGEHLAAMREHGLRLQVGHDHHVVEVDTVGDPSELAWTDDTVVLLAVKSQQTAAVLDALLPHLPTATPVVSLQNGVANERTLLRHVPRVHGVTVMMPASHLRPGEVTVHSAGVPALLDIGRFPAGLDDVDHAVAADFVHAGFVTEPRPDVMAWKHRKLVMNLGNAVDAACRDDDAADQLVRRARVEGELVLSAAGIEVVSDDADRERRSDLLRPLVDREGAGSSTWQSVQRGTGDVEVDHLNGEIVLQGRLHGVPTPVNELLQHTLHDLVRRGGEVASLDAGDLLRRLGAP